MSNFAMKKVENWWVGVYVSDVYQYLLKKECKRPAFQQHSPQLSCRTHLVDFLTAVCEQLKFCTSVRHLSVYILDMFMDSHYVQIEHLHLIAIGCLIVAVKVDECDILIPRMSDFNAVLGNAYKLSELVEVEVYIMEFLNWELTIPTAATFVDYYTLYAIRSSDYHSSTPLRCLKEAKEYLQQYVNYFLDLVLQDFVFLKFPPSVVAASCVAASRISLGLYPRWPSYLEDVTYYKFSELKPCVELLLKNLQQVHTQKATRKNSRKSQLEEGTVDDSGISSSSSVIAEQSSSSMSE